MGQKTSVYLSDELAERWRASSLPLSEVIRLGLDAADRAPDLEGTIRRVIREELAALAVDGQQQQTPRRTHALNCKCGTCKPGGKR